MAQNEDIFKDEDVTHLPNLFKDGLDLFNNLGKSDEATNCLKVQLNVKKCIKIFEKITVMVSYAGIFSKNEGIEEVATEDLQYFLIPAILGTLHLKLTSGARSNIVEVTEIYFKDFIKRCNEYNLCSHEFNEKGEEELKKDDHDERKVCGEELTVLAKQRAFKIKRYRECQELKHQLEDLKKNMENDHMDEEIKRSYFLTMIQLYICEAIDELSSIKLEKSVLEYIKKNKNYEKPNKKRPCQSFKPIIITRDAVQKAVYGAGYPSLPTMTVQEFYEKRVRDGVFPDPTKSNNECFSLQRASTVPEEESVANEKKDENNDEEYIRVMRKQDKFKDDHRRGCGNRLNRS